MRFKWSGKLKTVPLNQVTTDAAASFITLKGMWTKCCNILSTFASYPVTFTCFKPRWPFRRFLVVRNCNTLLITPKVNSGQYPVQILHTLAFVHLWNRLLGSLNFFLLVYSSISQWGNSFSAVFHYTCKETRVEQRAAIQGMGAATPPAQGPIVGQMVRGF